jgi:uncharacterized protein (TIGR02391 family)
MSQDGTFSESQMWAIADALADTAQGLTGSEISHLLVSCGMEDPTPTLTKRHRLYNAFAANQTARSDRRAILAFIRKSIKPERFGRCPERFEPLRANLNVALAFAGLLVEPTGALVAAETATTLAEAQRRARELRADLISRGTHPDVLRFCREELLVDDYFHAVLEAVKSVADKLRNMTGLTDDGSTLTDRALGGSPPMLAINALRTESEIMEQKGFANLVRGTFGMFRNPTAHAPRIQWVMAKEDAEDLLSLVSLIHRRLDAAHRPPAPDLGSLPPRFMSANVSAAGPR